MEDQEANLTPLFLQYLPKGGSMSLKRTATYGAMLSLLLAACIDRQQDRVRSLVKNESFETLVEFAESEIVAWDFTAIDLVPALESDAPVFAGLAGRVQSLERSVSSHRSFDAAVCTEAGLTSVSEVYGCPYPVVLEALRRVQGIESRESFVRRIRLWLSDLTYFPDQDVFLNTNRASGDAIELFIGTDYRRVWINQACKRDSAYIRGQGWVVLASVSCRYFPLAAVASAETVNFVSRSCRKLEAADVR